MSTFKKDNFFLIGFLLTLQEVREVITNNSLLIIMPIKVPIMQQKVNQFFKLMFLVKNILWILHFKIT